MKIEWTALAAAALILTAGCGGGDAKEAAVMNISAQEAKSMMDKEQDEVILDVREKNEYDSGHIQGAVLLPVGTITEETAAKVIPSKDTTVLVYCRSGMRAGKAAEKLANLGYKKVYNFGGILDWPYEVVK